MSSKKRTQTQTTVTVQNPDGTETTTETTVVETTEHAAARVSFSSDPVEVADSEMEVPPVEKVIVAAVVEGAEVVQQGLNYARKMGKVFDFLFSEGKK